MILIEETPAAEVAIEARQSFSQAWQSLYRLRTGGASVFSKTLLASHAPLGRRCLLLAAAGMQLQRLPPRRCGFARANQSAGGEVEAVSRHLHCSV